MKVKILGNGGAISDGLPYNSFMVDDFLLVESPPDVVNSLFRENMAISDISAVYVSHFHGDHYFGLPFLLLRIFFNNAGKPLDRTISIIGPGGIRERTFEICGLALRNDHPLIEWIDGNFKFHELSPGVEIELLNGTCLRPFRMLHSPETFGFTLFRNGSALFSYFADTVWDDVLISEIRLFPPVILADMNGEPGDPRKVHMSEEDVIINALPHSGGRSIFYGTHLKYQKQSSNSGIKYVTPGDIITI